jgi:hypothetical protein
MVIDCAGCNASDAAKQRRQISPPAYGPALSERGLFADAISSCATGVQGTEPVPSPRKKEAELLVGTIASARNR